MNTHEILLVLGVFLAFVTLRFVVPALITSLVVALDHRFLHPQV